MHTVANLRKQGFKVRVNHFRNIVSDSTKEVETEVPAHMILPDDEILPHGGKTEVLITTPDGKDMVGESMCHENDHFNKKLGVTIAIGRAMKNK